MKRFCMIFLTIALVLATLALPAQAVSRKVITLDSIGATIVPAHIDTSSTISTGAYDDMLLFVSYEGDSATVTVQESVTGATWYTMATMILNGTDGTQALQFFGPLVGKGSAAASLGTLTEFPLPPLNYTRVILNNHDKADADTLGSVTVKLIMER